jgi:hypothetical protein
MSIAEALSNAEVLRLPPMLFGSVRWHKGFGTPVSDPCSGFKIIVDEHTVSQFRMGPSGPEVIPGTGMVPLDGTDRPHRDASDVTHNLFTLRLRQEHSVFPLDPPDANRPGACGMHEVWAARS